MPNTASSFFSHDATSDLTTLLGREPTAAEGEANLRYPCLVPMDFLRRAREGDGVEPLLRQVVPDGREVLEVAGFGLDPLAEQGARPLPGVIRRFRGRALLLASAACAIHCRYCFRRHDPFQDIPRCADEWLPALHHLAADSSVHEVILSGGDPLTLDDDFIAWLIGRLATIDHIQTVRIHTRMAVVVPERVGDGLIRALTATRLQGVVMVHVNHGLELSEEAVAVCQQMAHAGILLFNQSVLLAGVNDSASVLIELSHALIRGRIAPCYLHLLDLVAGAAHFQVSAAVGGRLIQTMRRLLPGYAVPRLVREIPAKGIKKIISA